MLSLPLEGRKADSPLRNQPHRRHLQHAGSAAVLSLRLRCTRFRHARLRCCRGSVTFAELSPRQPRGRGEEFFRHEGPALGCHGKLSSAAFHTPDTASAYHHTLSADPHVPTGNYRQAVCFRTGAQALAGQIRYLPRMHRHPAAVARKGSRRARRVKEARGRFPTTV